MAAEHYRYFIELYHPTDAALGRAAEHQARQHRAHAFAEDLLEWLRGSRQEHLVTKLQTTLMGQIELLADPFVVEQIRHMHLDGVTAIRASGQGAIGTARPMPSNMHVSGRAV